MSFLKSLFAPTVAAKAAITSPVDMVIHASGLVSNTGDIDPFLDKMRIVTAQLAPNQQPAGQARQTLLEVYLAIEDYLEHKEPIRRFSKEELRGRLSPELRQELDRLVK